MLRSNRRRDAPVHRRNQLGPLALAQIGEADGNNQEGFEPFAEGDDKRLQHMIRRPLRVRRWPDWKVRLGLVFKKSNQRNIRPVKSDFQLHCTMRSLRKLLISHEVKKSCSGCCLLLCGGFTAFAQQPTFRTGTRTVALYATVTDAQKRLVPDLTQEDFEILDNDKPQAIDLFVNEVQPITVVVMLDTSASMTGNLEAARAGRRAVSAFACCRKTRAWSARSTTRSSSSRRRSRTIATS